MFQDRFNRRWVLLEEVPDGIVFQGAQRGIVGMSTPRFRGVTFSQFYMKQGWRRIA
jgi:hypothetical protein